MRSCTRSALSCFGFDDFSFMAVHNCRDEHVHFVFAVFLPRESHIGYRQSGLALRVLVVRLSADANSFRNASEPCAIVSSSLVSVRPGPSRCLRQCFGSMVLLILSPLSRSALSLSVASFGDVLG